MYEVYENSTLHRRPPVAAFDTFWEAEAYVMTNFPIIVFEVDEDHEGCADFFTRSGIIGQIEWRRA